MIKMTQKQIDKLFIGMAHDLRSKLIESVETIYENLFPNGKKDAVDTEYLMSQIRSRLLIEFGWLVSDDQLRSMKDGDKKKRTRKKKTLEKVV